MIETKKSGSLGVNTYIISNEAKECVVIDPGMDFKDNYDYITSLYEVKAVLLTHGHVDHIDGVSYFDCPIYILKEEINFLSDKTLSLHNMFNMNIGFNVKNKNIICVNDNDKINLIGKEFLVIKTSGHTIGSCCYKMGNKLFSGDTLFKGSSGRTDFPTGNEKEMQKSLVKIIDNLDDSVVVYPGHEQKTTIKQERKENPFYLYAKKILK